MKRKKIIVKTVGCIVILLAVYFPIKKYLVERFGTSGLHVGKELLKQRLGLNTAKPNAPVSSGFPSDKPPVPLTQIDDKIRPFKEIGSQLGERAKENSSFHFRGVVIFDANNDNRLDLFFPHNGRPRAYATDKNDILLDTKVPAKPCVLYLNRGTAPNGDPVYASVQELQEKGNALYVREELLIENKYKPRASIHEDEFRIGRIALSAVAADVNGDSLQDLIVGNTHNGIPFQTEALALPSYPARENIGRDEIRKVFLNRTSPFLRGKIEDGKDAMVDFSGRAEPEGRNSLFLNKGDQDNDGLPEWEDVTEDVGFGGRWATQGFAVADIDRDGDLDIYVANFLDPDFWGFGTMQFSGNRNEFYINQLVETGVLQFEESAKAYGVAGLHKEEELAAEMWIPAKQRFKNIAHQTHAGKAVGEAADHSWAAQFLDWNYDGWPDLIVANDIGNRLRVYKNEQGKSFKRITVFDEPYWDGCWMGMASGDLDGDLKDEILLSNCGSQGFTARNNAMFMEEEQAESIQGLFALNAINGISSPLNHTVLKYDHREQRLSSIPTACRVIHSPVIPPDSTRKENIGKEALTLFEKYNYSETLSGMEFAWGFALFDIDNDSDLDIYMAGSLGRGNDGLIGDWSGSPGRLLVNESRTGALQFRDLTLTYRLLDVSEIDYDANPPRRKAPGTNWHKRDSIYVTDTDSYSETGLEASQKSKIVDILRMHEAANGMVAGDLNQDGYEDLVVTHSAGYNSNLSSARNLKVKFMGKVLAVPAPNKLNKPPIQFEEGPTFVYINGGPPEGKEPRWVNIRLLDESGFNRYGVGAKIIINDKIMRRLTIGGHIFSGVMADLHIGLGDEDLKNIKVYWPSGEMDPQVITFDPPLSNKRVCIDKIRGQLACQ